MELENTIGRCLASQEIRQRIHEGGIIVPQFNENRIQPCSFEPTLGGEVFVLDSVPSPNTSETFYRTLLELPKFRRNSHSLEGGFEMKRGFSYLVPLEERVTLSGLTHIKSSPKSSAGRIFLHPRLIGDYNDRTDQIVSNGHQNSLQLWLLVEPHRANVIVRPGDSLNQLRFFTGYDAQLTIAEIIEMQKRSPFVFESESGHPADLSVTDEGLTMHLNLSGNTTEGIVGLRARHNPDPIDLSARELMPEQYFEPVTARDGVISLQSGEYYLLSTQEVLRIPSCISTESQRFGAAYFTGFVDFAGFVDPGFSGDLVLELRSDEKSSLDCKHGRSIATLKVYRTNPTDKLYGVKTGAHYQEQRGPRVAKFFRPFDYGMAAKNIGKLSRDVLVQDAHVLHAYNHNSGFQLLDAAQEEGLLADIKRGFFHSRYNCEDDERLLQLIPYVLLFGPERRVFSYVRANHIKDYGDERLFGKHSVGLGGHINRNDGPSYLESCIRREVLQEEVDVKGTYSNPLLMGTLSSCDRPVDRVHFGLIYAIHTSGDIAIKESSLVSGRMASISELLGDSMRDQRYETWSRILIPYLPDLYRRSTSN